MDTLSVNEAQAEPRAVCGVEGLERDEEGYLLCAGDWHPGLIEPLAAESGLLLDAERLEIIRYIRGHFEASSTVPEARVVLRHMRGLWGEEKGTRRHLYRLFPRGYGQQACKIAGMRKPRKLMLDV